MKIYHGTGIKNLEAILKDGIKPRGENGGNWDKYPSIPGHVYLTTSYPFYFALTQKEEQEKDKPVDGRVVVFEIDTKYLDHEKFYPDEDFISQAVKDLKNHKSYRDNIEFYKDKWRLSLQYLGNCSFKGTIPAKAITRYVILDYKKKAAFAMGAMDPTISIQNFQYCSDKYHALVAWAFGDSPNYPGYTESKALAKLGVPFEDKRLEWLKKASKDRDGIEVVKVGKVKQEASK